MTLLPILLPEGFAPKVSVDDKLTAGQIIAEKSQKGIEEVIHVSQIFAISPKHMAKTLRKNLGDSVSKEDVLAVKKGRLGLGAKKIISEFSGTIIRIDEENGDVLIHTGSADKNLITLISPVDGTVDFCNNDKIVIKTDKEALLAEEAVGEEARGELFVIEDKDIDFSEVPKEVAKKIVLGGKFEKGSIFKALGLGALGVIGVEIRDSDFEDLEEKGIKLPVFQIEEKDFSKLAKHKEGQVYLDPENKSIVVL
ncbi:MAG: hypothetical protein M1444_00090 [Patescibacteria group bacterium]|nr:hypothetical protein [Patescibacteria group bacterium]